MVFETILSPRPPEQSEEITTVESSDEADCLCPNEQHLARAHPDVAPPEDPTSSRALGSTSGLDHEDPVMKSNQPVHKDRTSTVVVEEDCPLCCSPMSPADLLVPLPCPTPTCHFLFCSDCLQGMILSAADGYQQASDGSFQLRTTVACPLCRSKYTSASYRDDSLVLDAVLTSRLVYTLQSRVLPFPDEAGSASLLLKKQLFLEQFQHPKQLQDVLQRMQIYWREIGKWEEFENQFPLLDIPLWQQHMDAFQQMRPSQASSSSSCTSGAVPSKENLLLTTAGLQRRPRSWADPTLFFGMEDLMTRDEQEFVTQLLTSGQVECVAQAAQIVAGILAMAAQRQAAQTVQQLSQWGGNSSSTKTALLLHKIRKRFPLPKHMPRAVMLPLCQNKKGGFDDASTSLLQFQGKQDLVLAQVRGVAGRRGLRIGDVLTQIDIGVLTAVHSQAEYREGWQQAVQSVQHNGADLAAQEWMIVVNATEKVALDLQKRAADMQAANIRFS